MAQLILTRNSQFHRAIRTGGSFPLSLNIGKFFLFFTMTFLIGFLGFLYLVKFTEIHTKGYQLRKLELEKTKLLTAQEMQLTNIAKLRSLSTIRESDVASRMVQMKAPIYVTKEGSLASLPRY